MLHNYYKISYNSHFFKTKHYCKGSFAAVGFQAKRWQIAVKRAGFDMVW